MKDSYSEHIKKLLQIGKEKADHSTEKSAKDFTRHHTKEDTQMAISI